MNTPGPVAELADRALSIRQPWAELILLGRKRYELRSWKTSHRGPILIHAAQRVDKLETSMAGLDVENLAAGAIVGMVDIVDCEPFTPEIADELRQAQSYFREWVPNLYAWKLERPLRMPEPIPYRGALGLFRVCKVIGRNAGIDHSLLGCQPDRSAVAAATDAAGREVTGR